MRHPVSALFSATWIFTAMMIGRGVTHAQTPAAPHAFPVRTWTSINGNTADGTFQREANGRIYFKHVNGMSIAINRDRLAPDDLAWVDAQVQRVAAHANPGSAPEIATFPALTANEMQRLPNYRKLRKLDVKTYAKRTDNHREDKALAFLIRDAEKIFGWSYVVDSCYPNADGTKGMLKDICFYASEPYGLGEAAYILRDKFSMDLPYPIRLKKVVEGSSASWELLDPPDYVTKVELRTSFDGQKINSFFFNLPKPEQMIKTQ